MAQVCAICGKGRQLGNRISHAHNVSRREWRPNLHTVHALVEKKPRRIKVCTRCLRSGKVTKISR